MFFVYKITDTSTNKFYINIEQFEDWWKDTEEQGFDIKFEMS